MQNQSKNRKQNNTEYYMHGKHAVFAAINNTQRIIRRIYCIDKYHDKIADIAQKSINHTCPITVVQNDFIIKKIGQDLSHQGIIALVKPITLTQITQLTFMPKKDRIVILDQITDPQNIGAIIRSAVAFGIHKMIMTNNNAPEENALIAKAASGCLELMQIARVTNLRNTINQLKKKEFWIAGLDNTGPDTPNTLQDIEKLAIIIGSEQHGMRTLTTKHCDFVVKIPISNQVESLNASNAASIIFYNASMINTP